ncbi:hypothetical protein ACE103_35725 [Bradyrhizobium sp. ma5]|uniref:hypothetical protein n=1 Tax=Bradyrhizobium sp. ma5 TaxID=3344828 RepID=UPI0035D46B40
MDGTQVAGARIDAFRRSHSTQSSIGRDILEMRPAIQPGGGISAVIFNRYAKTRYAKVAGLNVLRPDFRAFTGRQRASSVADVYSTHIRRKRVPGH